MTQPDTELVAALAKDRYELCIAETSEVGAEKWDGLPHAVQEMFLAKARDWAPIVRSRIEQAVAATAERAAHIIECGSPMSTEKQSRQYFAAAILRLANADVQREQAQAVAEARLESARKVISHAPGRLPQAVQDYIAELQRQLADLRAQEGKESEKR